MKTTFGGKTFGCRTFACLTLAGGLPAVALSIVRIGNVTEVTVVTSLADPVWYHWYLDGSYIGKTTGPRKSFHTPAGEQFRVEVRPTDDADFDPIANAPDGYPSRKTLWWVRSPDGDAAGYRVEQRIGSGEWSTIGEFPQAVGQWEFLIITGQLNDLAEYTWRITPLDAAGNAGTPITVGPEKIVRWPDAPNFTAEFDPETELVTFAEAE